MRWYFLGLLLLFVPVVFATIPAADTAIYLTLDDADLSSSNPTDATGNYTGFSNLNADTGSIGQINEAFTFVGSDTSNEVVFPSDFTPTGPFTYSTWIKPGVQHSNNIGMFAHSWWYRFNSFDESGCCSWYLYYDDSADAIKVNLWGGAAITSSGNFPHDEWMHVVLTWDGTTGKLYVNGTLEGSNTATESYGSSGTFFPARIGRFTRNSGVPTTAYYWYTGEIDEVAYFHKVTFSASEVQELYDAQKDGFESGQYPFSNIVDVNHSLEDVVVANQVSNVTVNSASFVNVLNESFDINASVPAYSAWAFNLESGSASQVAYCRVLLDGEELGSSVNRSFSATSQVASLYTVSDVTALSDGSHWVALQCRRSSGPLLVFGSKGIVHLLGHDGINVSFINDSFVSSGFGVVHDDVFNSSVVSNGSLSRIGVLNARVVANYGSASDFAFSASLNGSRFTSVVDRSGGAGSIGSAALIGIVDLLPNSTYNLSFNLSSSSGDGSIAVNYVFKEFVLNSTEFNSSIGSLAISGSSWTNASVLSISNLEHLSSNVLAKAVIDASSVSGSSSVDFRFLLNSSEGSVFSRDFTTSSGVLIMQEVFRNVSFGVYDVVLQYRGDGSAVNGGFGFESYLAGDVDFNESFFLVNASHRYNGSKVFDFNVTDSLGSVFESNSSGYARVVPTGSSVDFVVSSLGFVDRSVSSHNPLFDYWANLTPKFYFSDVYFGGLVEYSGVNYSSNLSTRAEYVCESGKSVLFSVFRDGVLSDSFSGSCVGNLINTSNIYTPSSSGSSEVVVSWNASITNFSSDVTFDVDDPVVSSAWGVGRGFNNENVSGWFACSDVTSPVANLSSFWNGAQFFFSENESLPANESFSNSSGLGTNYLYTSCVDLVGNDGSFNDSEVVFSSFFYLVNEQTGNNLSSSNLSSVVAYVDENSISYNLVDEGVDSFNFTTTESEVLRFEFIYSDGFVLNRYIDVSLLLVDDVRVCVPPDDNLQFYEKLFLSSSDSKVVRFEAMFPECIVLLDRTRFAYQDSFSLRTFTIDTSYDLSTLDSDGDLVLLASIDGGLEAFINVDVLEFSREQVPISIQPESIVFKKQSNTSILINYVNSAGDNTGLSLTISRTDTGAVVYSDSSFADPNNVVLIWDFSSLSNVSDVLFKVEVVSTAADGSSSVKKAFFTTSGTSGLINPKVAFAFAFIILLFGLTFTTAQVSLSWLGLFLTIGSLGILAASVWTASVLLLGAVNIFIIVYIVVLMNMQTTKAVVT